MKLSIVLFFCVLLSGCISTAGQYRGAANGVEISLQPDGTRIINVSGDAEIKIDQNNTLTATSRGNLQSILDIAGKLQ